MFLDFADIHLDVDEYLTWKDVYDAKDPLALLRDPVDSPKFVRDREFNLFHLVMILRCIRPDAALVAAATFIEENFGRDLVQPPPFDLQASYDDSKNTMPLVFVLSAGSDPLSQLNKFANDNEKTIATISMGQGQGPKAQKLLDEGVKIGNWTVLQNCHFAGKYIYALEQWLEVLSPHKTHKDFRLWLTSMPTASFPVAILQNSVKMTMEPPKGLKANLTGSYNKDPINSLEFYNGHSRPNEFKRLTFGLCFFHAVIQERRLYGPLGWNIPYEFTDSDLRISVQQLYMFLEEAEEGEVPWKALLYLTGECNYGGRVTDDKDRILLNVLLRDYFALHIFDPEHKFGGVEEFGQPQELNYHKVLEHIGEFALFAPPAIFGFHENASFTKQMNEAYALFDQMLLTEAAGGGGGGRSPDEVVGEIATDILTRMPDCWDLAAVSKKYPIKYEESMNTVLIQEMTRYNGLIAVVLSSLKDIKKAIQGLLLMSEQLEQAYNFLFDGRTPAMWMDKSYPSLKPLGSYVNDLVERLKFFEKWNQQGIPIIFWFSGIFFTQAFTTGTSQNYARKHGVAIDLLAFDFYYPKLQRPDAKPDDGTFFQKHLDLKFENDHVKYVQNTQYFQISNKIFVFSLLRRFCCRQTKRRSFCTHRHTSHFLFLFVIYIFFFEGAFTMGLFLEGARWCKDEQVLRESEPKILFTPMATILIVPNKADELKEYPSYMCPCYKISSRRGTLSTTGHSTNFVMFIKTPSDIESGHWTKRGVAFLTQLDT